MHFKIGISDVLPYKAHKNQIQTAFACPNFLIWSKSLVFDGNTSEQTLHFIPVSFYFAAFFSFFNFAFPFFLPSPSSSLYDSLSDSFIGDFGFFASFLFLLFFSSFYFMTIGVCAVFFGPPPKAAINASVSFSDESESEDSFFFSCFTFFWFFLLITG